MTHRPTDLAYLYTVPTPIFGTKPLQMPELPLGSSYLPGVQLLKSLITLTVLALVPIMVNSPPGDA